MRERHAIRSRRFDALQNSIDESEPRASSLTTEIERQEAITQRTWLDALEGEVEEERVSQRGLSCSLSAFQLTQA